MVGRVIGPLFQWRSLGQSMVVLPSLGSTLSWELFRRQRGDLIPFGSSNDLQSTAIKRRATLALPTAELFCLTLWLNETDEEKFSPMIVLQLELRGFKLSGHSGLFDWSVVLTDKNRTLVLVGLLPTQLPTPFLATPFEDYDVAARFRSYEPDSITLWSEQGRLCLACTRGGNLAYFQSLPGNTLTPAAIRDLVCIHAALNGQQVLSALRTVVLWLEPGPEIRSSLCEAFSVDVRVAKPGAPRPPAKPWSLHVAQPESVRPKTSVVLWRSPYLRGLALIYVLVFSLLLGQLGFTSIQNWLDQAWLDDHRQVLDKLQQTQMAWNFLEPLVQKEEYPLEVLLHCATARPNNDTHLVFFDQQEGRVRLQAQTRNAAQAEAFLERLQHDPSLSSYQWSMIGSPQIVTSDQAQLQIEGTHATSNPQ